MFEVNIITAKLQNMAHIFLYFDKVEKKRYNIEKRYFRFVR